MSLPAVDENWYCEDCDLNFEYCDKPDFFSVRTVAKF